MTDHPEPRAPARGEPDGREAALTRLARAAYSVSAADARLRGRATRVPGAVSLAHARALRILAEQGPISIGRLATGTETTSAAATQLVNGLIRAGYVTRERDPENGRAVRITLTPEGRARNEERERHLADLLAQAFAHLDPREIDTAADALRRLVTVYDSL